MNRAHPGIPFLIVLATLAILPAARPAHAVEAPASRGERAKAAVHAMVLEVRAAETPAAKRAVLEAWVARAEGRAALLAEFPLAGAGRRAAAAALHEKFAGYALELKGTGGADGAGVADADLDAFAAYIQQDLEQAASAYWSNGGLYLSTGAIIIILIILILLN